MTLEIRTVEVYTVDAVVSSDIQFIIIGIVQATYPFVDERCLRLYGGKFFRFQVVVEQTESHCRNPKTFVFIFSEVVYTLDIVVVLIYQFVLVIAQSCLFVQLSHTVDKGSDPHIVFGVFVQFNNS